MKSSSDTGKGDDFVRPNKSGFPFEVLFVTLQAVLYAVFLTFDITGSRTVLSSYIKFSIIILCFCYALLLGKSTDKSIIFVMRAGLLFTVISDLFLLILDYYIYGVITFIVVQQLYGMRLLLSDIGRQNKTENMAGGRSTVFFRRLACRILMQAVAAFMVSFILKLLGVTLEGLLVLSIFYFVSIVTNVLTAVIYAIREPYNRSNVIFAAGMVLFLLCDINVGIFNLSGFIVLPEHVYQLMYSVSSILMWTFYAPSQVLIALSTKNAAA
jgi:hypothetical protein